MRKLIQYDKLKMKEYGYNGSPLRQILMLNLSSEEMIILLNFFSHKSDWTIGNNGITEKNFYKEKNQKRVNVIISKLKGLSYITETDTQYIINLDKIHTDYIKNLEEVNQRSTIKRLEKAKKRNKNCSLTGGIESTPSEQFKNTLTGGIESTPQGGIESTPKEGIESTPNNINNHGQSTAPKAQTTTLNNKTKGSEIVVGDCSASCASFGRTSQTTPTGMGLNGNTVRDTIPKVITHNTPSLDCERSEQTNKSTTNKIVENMPNDLQFLIDNSLIFKNTYDYSTVKGYAWSECDISNYNNAYIANAVVLKLKGCPIKDIPSNTYNLITVMVRLSQKIDDSKLWQEFIKQCNNDSKIISKLTTT